MIERVRRALFVVAMLIVLFVVTVAMAPVLLLESVIDLWHRD